MIISTKFQPSREASRILGVHPNSLRKWADNGEINCIRTKSGQRRYDVDSYIGKSTSSTTICFGSGLNFKRKGLKAILERAMSGTHITLVVAHRDRLARFGIDLIRQVLEQNGGKLVVLDETLLSPEQELTDELLDILDILSARMPKLRSYKKQINQIIADNGTETSV